ncbi:MAG: metal-dependent hydrolase [Candidatus Shikimatogenerans bostrichidophilus]|nr:MAG: metal-dependent hydrolase [Candidatus Shikimatogenerans bostrichidophilus]
MKIKYYTHSTLLLLIERKKILVDPFFTGNPKLNKKFNILKTINKIDYILVTHAHIDHTKDVEFISKKFNAIIISNYEICAYYKKKQCKTFSFNFGSFININKNIFIKYVYALHSSSFEDGTYGGNPGGFIIKYNTRIIYISGDTDLFYNMKKFKFKFKLLILPIGGRYTMNIKDALYASKLLNCNYILGVHYNTFPEIVINKKKALNLFKKKKKKLFLLNYNKNIIIK